MKAWMVKSNGEPARALVLNSNAVPPSPSAVTGSTLLVRVRYAALNPADLVVMRYAPTRMPLRSHQVAGMDFSGEVTAAGPDAPDDMQPGALVCGALSLGALATGRGTLTHQLLVPAEQVAVVPDGTTLQAAAGLAGIAGQTAAAVLREAGALGPASRVLINGASGGVGSFAVQVASCMGAKVVGICSGANAAMVRRLGADDVVDYTAHASLGAFLADRYGAPEANFDVAFDFVGVQALFDASPGFLKPGGSYLNIVGGGPAAYVVNLARNHLLPVFLGGTPRRYKQVNLLPNGDMARQMATWVQKGAVREVAIDSEWAMEQAVEAYEKLATKRAKGKIVIKVQDSGTA